MKIEKLGFHDATDATLDQLTVLLREFAPGSRAIQQDLFWLMVARNVIFVARTPEGQIVGMVQLAAVFKWTGLECRGAELIVLEAFRGQGISKLLAQAMIDQARSIHASHIEFTCKPSREAANKLYPKLGAVRRETNVYRLDLR